MTHLLGILILTAVLGGCLALLPALIADTWRRGAAPIHDRAGSWQPRVPTQRQDAA